MREMNYREAREYVALGGNNGAIELGLDTIRELCRRLGNPQDGLRFVHIAGTNGKGSVLAYVSTVLKEGGYRVGRYISPTLFSYRERIQVNEEYIAREDFTRLVNKIAGIVEDMEQEGLSLPSPFEIETALCFLYFKEQDCDIVVLETGMGGLEDATNVIASPVMEILVPISMDHMGFLGSTLGEIAQNKAGIIKENTRVITADQEEEAMAVIRQVCREKHAALRCVEKENLTELQPGLEEQSFYWNFKEEGRRKICIHLAGSYQIINAGIALTALESLREAGFFLDAETIERGMEKTCWRGRFTLLGKEPICLIDGAHNEAGARQLRRSLLQYFPGKRIYFIMGMFGDKEYEKVAALTAPLAEAVFTVETPDNPRALPAEELARAVGRYHSRVRACHSLKEGVQAAYEAAEKQDVIVAFGSLSFLGELEAWIQKYRKN